MSLRCNLCERDLKPHCADEHCDWWTCSNRACEARTYDVARGILVHEDGQVERLGTQA